MKLTVKQKVEIRQNLQQQVTEPIDDFYNRCVHAQYLVSDGDCTIDAFFNREVLLHFLIGLVPFIRNKVLEADCSSAVDFIQEAKRAAQRALPVTDIKSSLLSGTIALIPLKRIPTLLKLANPQRA